MRALTNIQKDEVAQQRVNLVQKLNIRLMFVSEMVNFYDVALDAKISNISSISR